MAVGGAEERRGRVVWNDYFLCAVKEAVMQRS